MTCCISSCSLELLSLMMTHVYIWTTYIHVCSTYLPSGILSLGPAGVDLPKILVTIFSALLVMSTYYYTPSLVAKL